MKTVLLSGGSGKRLWPLSNDSRSKQFLKVLDNNGDGLQSMLQRVWKQLERQDLVHSSVLTTSKVQVEMIYSQLESDINLIVEPSRRDTFPAIALAASYIYSVQKCSLDEVIVVLPVDPYVEDEFFSRIKELEYTLKISDADIALMGVRPTYPSEKYGYIVPKAFNNTEGNYFNVDYFTEKPNKEKASFLIKKHALWNCGVFAFKLKYLISLMEKMNIPTEYNQLLVEYNNLPKISFDYEVVEKTDNIVAISYDGYWKDLGTWNTLTEEMSINKIGKGVISQDCTNVHLINELEIPVTVNGISDVIVAVSPDGILVSDKEASPKIKEVVNIFDDRPMYEERRWGWYRILDYNKLDSGQEILTKKICILEGKNLSYHYHEYRDEIWTIIDGEGEIIFNNQIQKLRAGDVVKINSGEKHSIIANTNLEIIEVQKGSQLIEADIVRVFEKWEEIMSNVINSNVQSV
ncbi:Alginate biosynthesis protein AlgA [Mycobacteroides abscessus subsp. abscessus]|nr:Alginate biosynthesis protein AlgA [Mycobacteroides abscessus subsp. abscessus]